MICPLVAALEDGPCGFDAVGVGIALDVFLARVIDLMVIVVLAYAAVSVVIVWEHRRSGCDVFAYELVQDLGRYEINGSELI